MRHFNVKFLNKNDCPAVNIKARLYKISCCVPVNVFLLFFLLLTTNGGLSVSVLARYTINFFPATSACFDFFGCAWNTLLVIEVNRRNYISYFKNWHGVLYGIGGIVLEWFRNYITKRYQCVRCINEQIL